MQNPWRFFIVMESLFLLGIFWQLFRSDGLLLVALLGVFLIYFALRKKRSRLKGFFAFLGIVLMLIAFFNSWLFWLMMVFTIVFIGLKGMEMTHATFWQKMPWHNKSIKIVETVPPTEKSGKRYKRPLFGNDRIGTNHVYEWEDINITTVAGDTIVDLGNTLLPKEENIVLIRKGIGETRVLVPTGVGLLVEHSTLYGKLVFDEENYTLKNESIRLYSKDYDDNPRRLRIITSSIVGDVEVIRI